jgi:cellulose synthase/poly-beta-1,6-N-acetylglucosamine synthase-like glycosyltransferase
VTYVGYAVLALLLAYLGLPLASWLMTLSKAFLRRTSSGVRMHDDEAEDVPVPLLFLVPAHNEAKVIERCVRSLMDQDYPRAMLSIVVIADNCDDETEHIVRGLGAECLVRVDPGHPGKPRAIAWALGELGDLSRWEACVIIDADSEVAPDFAKALASSAPLSNRVLQAYYGISNSGDSWLTRLARLLGRARYEVEYPLKSRAKLNCPLTGNGMCIGSEILGRHGWTAFSLTENWELYAEYTARGIRIDLADGARLYALESESLSSSRTRRSRWLRGRLHVLRAYWDPICRSRQIGWHQKLDAVAELAAMPPTVHAGVALAGAAVWFSVGSTSISNWLGAGLLLTLLPLASSSIIALARDPEPGKAIAALLRLPFYAIWRAALLIETLIFHRDSVWKKTERG